MVAEVERIGIVVEEVEVAGGRGRVAVVVVGVEEGVGAGGAAARGVGVDRVRGRMVNRRGIRKCYDVT